LPARNGVARERRENQVDQGKGTGAKRYGREAERNLQKVIGDSI
jgi:hypothetical protein